MPYRTQIHHLHSTLQSHGLESFLREYESLRRDSLAFHLSSALLELGLPVGHICDVLLRFEQMIGDVGIAEASRALLDQVGVHVEYDLSPDASRVLAEGAFIAYGNHTSGLESVLFDSLFVRTDVYQIGDANLARIGPNIIKTALLVENLPRPHNASAPRPLRSKLLDTLEGFFWPAVLDPNAVQRNRETLDRAADVVVAHRCGVNIYPAGSMRPDVGWRNGLGALVRRVLQHPQLAQTEVYVVPMVYGIEFVDVMASGIFPTLSPARAAARILATFFHGSPYVFVPQAIRLRDLKLDSTWSSSNLSERLECIWLDVLQMAHRQFSGPGFTRVWLRRPVRFEPA